MHVTLDREIGFSRGNGAAVDGDAGDGRGQRPSTFGAHRCGHRVQGPQRLRAHATLAANAAAAAS